LRLPELSLLSKRLQIPEIKMSYMGLKLIQNPEKKQKTMIDDILTQEEKIFMLHHANNKRSYIP